VGVFPLQLVELCLHASGGGGGGGLFSIWRMIEIYRVNT